MTALGRRINPSTCPQSEIMFSSSTMEEFKCQLYNFERIRVVAVVKLPVVVVIDGVGGSHVLILVCLLGVKEQ